MDNLKKATRICEIIYIKTRISDGFWGSMCSLCSSTMHFDKRINTLKIQDDFQTTVPVSLEINLKIKIAFFRKWLSVIHYKQVHKTVYSV